MDLLQNTVPASRVHTRGASPPELMAMCLPRLEASPSPLPKSSFSSFALKYPFLEVFPDYPRSLKDIFLNIFFNCTIVDTQCHITFRCTTGDWPSLYTILCSQASLPSPRSAITIPLTLFPLLCLSSLRLTHPTTRSLYLPPPFTHFARPPPTHCLVFTSFFEALHSL